MHEPHETVARLTPHRDLFVLPHLGIPRVDLAQWRLQIEVQPTERARNAIHCVAVTVK